ELRGDVLRIRRAAAVAEQQDLVTAAKRVGDEPDGAFEVCRVLAQEDALRVQAVVEDCADGVLRGGHDGRNGRQQLRGWSSAAAETEALRREIGDGASDA